MKFKNVDTKTIFGGLLSAKEIKEKLFHIAEFKSISTFSEVEKKEWISAAQNMAKITKYTPEMRFLVFVIRPFVRIARAIRQAATIEADKNFDAYAYDIIGDDSPMVKKFLKLSNNEMRENAEKSLAVSFAIDKIVAEILDDELDAWEALFYKAFPQDIELVGTIVPIEGEKPLKVAFEKSKETEVENKKKDPADAFKELLQMLGALVEEEKEKEKTVKANTPQNIATDFINSAIKTQKKSNKFNCFTEYCD